MRAGGDGGGRGSQSSAVVRFLGGVAAAVATGRPLLRRRRYGARATRQARTSPLSPIRIFHERAAEDLLDFREFHFNTIVSCLILE